MTLICKGSRSDHPAVPSAVNPGIAPLRLLLYRFLYICCRIEEEIAMVTAVAYTNFRKDPESYLCRVEPKTHGDVICTGRPGTGGYPDTSAR